MIQQTKLGLNSRSEANPYNEDGFLPLITAPMYSVVNKENMRIFLDNKINVCIPREEGLPDLAGETVNNVWTAQSLVSFKNYLDRKSLTYKVNVCIDTANGNIPELHEAIRKAKEIHGDNLIIMAGNVASVEAFVELAKTGVDYIRVGIGGGGGCNTTSNTGVGQMELEYLVGRCFDYRYREQNVQKGCHEEGLSKYLTRNGVAAEYHQEVYNNSYNISKVKIVADGISSYIKQCEVNYGFNDNGYAAINKLLFAGADLVMIGKLFAQCVESAGEKQWFGETSSLGTIRVLNKEENTRREEQLQELGVSVSNIRPSSVKYSGMSTQEEQEKYKNYHPKVGDIFYEKRDGKKHPIIVTMIEDGFTWGKVKSIFNSKEIGYSNNAIFFENNIKPSEGSIQWIPVRWTLDEWLNGSTNQDEAPYLMGWINSIKSAMAYTNKTTL